MTALHVHLNELVWVLRATAGLDLTNSTSIELREKIAWRLGRSDPLLADRLRRLDDWHTDALAQLVIDAHAMAQALEWPVGRPRGPTNNGTDMTWK